MRKQSALFLALSFVVSLFAATGAAAQGVQTGILSGVVKDPQGLPLPGATVTATSPALQGERTAVTDAIGAFIIRGLPPGNYTVRFQFTGTADVTNTVNVPLGGVAEVNTTMRLAALQEAVQVTADITPPALAVTQTSTNFSGEMISALPIGRRPFEIAELAPGVTDNTPNVGQIAIGGAFAFDSIFLVDGVDVNDNLFGSAHGLFIEGAILETQVVTSGASAEFGRFAGGVVNVITRSGGNEFSGSFRTNYTRPSWTDETPFQRNATPPQQNGVPFNPLGKFYEFTVGGPIVRDRLWFFNADRYENSSAPDTLRQVGTSYNVGTNNKRFEMKLTGTPITGHTVSGTFLNNPLSNTSRPSINAAASIDPAVLIDRSNPNKLWVVSYNGALSNKMFATFQWSDKDFGFRNAGGTSTNIIDSPYMSRGWTGIPSGLHYNAPYFSANDPEDRNNRQFSGSLSYFVTNPALGRHDLKVGGEYFTSWRTGGNSQSATGYVITTDYQVAGGRPVVDAAGHPIPIFEPAANGSRTLLTNWISSPGATLYIDTLSLYWQDRWQVGNRLTADLGLRFEDVNSEATGDIVGADTRTWLPRLGVSFDVEGNGRTIASATYGRYSGRFTERAFARNTNVGTPSAVQYAYIGPAGSGRDFAPALNLANYVVVAGSFPTANIFFDPDLTSPKTNEFTLALGRELPRGYVKGTYTWRNTSAFIEDFIDDPSAAGKVSVIRNGVNFGTFDRVLYKNTDLPKREYQAVQVEGRVTAWRFPINGNYTVQIKNHGTFEGEAANQPGNPENFHDYPEMIHMAIDRYQPYGRLNEFQRHKLRMWTTYTQSLGRAGTVDISPIWRVNSGLTYSEFVTAQPFGAAQLAANPGYARAATATRTVYFGERGSQSFKGYGLLDMSFRYGVPVWKTVQPWIQANVYNVLNNQKLIAWDTALVANTTGPRDAAGLVTSFTRGPRYGQATSNAHFPGWSTGQTGGRTFTMAMGIRF